MASGIEVRMVNDMDGTNTNTSTPATSPYPCSGCGHAMSVDGRCHRTGEKEYNCTARPDRVTCANCGQGGLTVAAAMRCEVEDELADEEQANALREEA